MPINSRSKGSAGEREFAALCREEGFMKCRRGQQYCGIEGEDVAGLPGVHVEVKRVEHLRLEEAMEQSIRDADEGKMPIVAHRRNRKNWLITLPLPWFFKLLKAYLKIKGEGKNE